jgi:hypothetical protein
LHSVELRSPEREVEEYRKRLAELAESIESALHVGNPIPAWLPLVFWGLLTGLLGVGGGLAIWRFWQVTEPIVSGVQQWAPLMAGAFTMLMYVLAFMPFLFIFNIVMTLLPR